MIQLFGSILYLISQVILLPPISYLNNQSGIFQEYGYEQNDSEKFAPIVHVIESGAFQIEEVDSSVWNKDSTLYSISLRGDSVEIQYRQEYDGKPGPVYSIERFSRIGKLLYRASYSKDKLEWLSYFGPDGSWVEYRHIWPQKNNHWLDTTILRKRILFDRMGRALEIDEFTGLDQIREFGKIARKTVYNYSNDGSETEELHYHWRFSDPHNEIRKEQWREYPDSIALKELLSRPLEYLLYSRKHEKIDSAARSIESETYDYYDGDSSITDWTYSFFNLDRAWHPIREIHKHKSPISPDTFEWKIKYVRNRKGLLLRKTFSDGGTSDMWTYDKNGNCTSHLQPHSRYHDVWKYDSKGNLVEFNTGSYKNTFKISYK